MHADIAFQCHSCSACQESKILSHICAPISSMAVPHDAYTHVHVDVVGPFPVLWGVLYLFTVVEAFPLFSMTAEECAQAICLDWIPQFDVSLHLMSDQDQQFMSAPWTQHSWDVSPPDNSLPFSS